MPIYNFTKSTSAPGFIPPALRSMRFTLSRDGLVNGIYKEAVLLSSLMQRSELVTVPINNGHTALFTALATALDGMRVMMVYDTELEPYAVVRILSITADTDLAIDLNNGSGGSQEPTDAGRVPAMIKVEKLPAGRRTVAVERKGDGTWRYAGGNRIESTGDVELQVTGGDVYIFAVDDYGILFQPALEISVGDTIRPSNYQGWLYRCTEAGTLPLTEPDWWPEQGDNPPRLVGTTRLQAVRYYRPLAHGPVNYELV